MGFEMLGFEAMRAKLREILGRVDQVTSQAAMRAGLEVQREAQRLLSMSSHAAGTPTPSAPGQPPSLISGALRRSITVDDPERSAQGWSINVGPTIVYGRVQELGGGPSNLPARPYMRPAWAILPDKVHDIFQDAWRDAVN